MKNIFTITAYIITAAFVAVLGVGIMVGLSRVDAYLKFKAFDDCAKAASYTFEQKNEKQTGESTTTTQVEPFRWFYKTCLEDKGYSTKLGDQ
jgi:hypothetical protein